MPVIAEWTHRGGSTVTLETLDGTAYAIRAPGAGAVFYADSDSEAVLTATARVAAGEYSRDAWTTPYMRVR